MQRQMLSRRLAAAGLLLLASGLLWAAVQDERPERLPPDWQPVSERPPAASADMQAGGTAVQAVKAEGKEQNAAAEPSQSADNDPAAAAAPHEAAPEDGGMKAQADDRPENADSGGCPCGAAPVGGFDINRATEAEWDELPGIGPAKAKAIVADRERNGPFRSVDDLARVKGIGPKLLERLREAIQERQSGGSG